MSIHKDRDYFDPDEGTDVQTDFKQRDARLSIDRSQTSAASWRDDQLHEKYAARANLLLFALGKTIEGMVISSILIFCLAIFLWSRLEHGPFWAPLVQWLHHFT